MVRFPNCKLNLGLHILGKRADGYHNLETVFYPLWLRDALEILPAPHLEKPLLSTSGLPVMGDATGNLCIKAWQLLKSRHAQMPAVAVHLHKAIPMGAGLGGGSADGAFMLSMLNHAFQLALSAEDLAVYALELGSDCPFFIYNQPCYATGRGEVLQPISLSLKGFYFYIINPGIHINTAAAFAQLQYVPHAASVREIIQQPIEEWKNYLQNDFEAGIAQQHVVIAQLKQKLYDHGALYAAMSGSGSTLFGLFAQQPTAMSLPSHYFTAIIAAQ